MTYGRLYKTLDKPNKLICAKHKRTPQAKQDLLEHVLYLAKINPELAERFIEASEVAFDNLAQMPKKGKIQKFRLPQLAGTRRWFIPGFNQYLIFYRSIKYGIESLRVLHGAQNIDAIMEDAESEDFDA